MSREVELESMLWNKKQSLSFVSFTQVEREIFVASQQGYCFDTKKQ